MQKILVVDDELKVLEVVEAYLKNDGYETYIVATGTKALELFRTVNPDLIILDLMLPDMSGEEICRIIRSESRVPIIMLTAKSHEDDRISGISMGADDYLVKPFSPRELVVRVRAILRRLSTTEPLTNLISFDKDHLQIDTIKHQVSRDGIILSLTPSEYKLLLLLASNPGRVFSRNELIERILGFDYNGYDRTIDTHIKNLRQKIENNMKSPEYIKTVFGIGYKFGG
ncbi:MAG: response regulator transcription factor [Firmicutes bacterium]|nr:response regulator transcription factor [Bacillota bacterium]